MYLMFLWLQANMNDYTTTALVALVRTRKNIFTRLRFINAMATYIQASTAISPSEKKEKTLDTINYKAIAVSRILNC